ncbi:E3 ubiquitin-protein ligase RNF180 [Pseudoliparis swirei]|uniref:E3 ubiquitin-protein ligase RNF180 n=1 Tax=Pseudoliparis swirei TaxID=2059687 RepID=UPI0024BEEF3D|nr:E3 ubiquitin-protein ligase RNF180 [Pseudoliparis swirei]
MYVSRMSKYGLHPDRQHRFEPSIPSVGDEVHVFCSLSASRPNQIHTSGPSETFIQEGGRKPAPPPAGRSILDGGENGGGSGRPSQSHPTRTPSLISSDRGEEEEEEEEEDGEEGGSGVMEVLGRTVTSEVVPTCVPFGMSKREKNRITCLRRRRRRKERWRHSQLQESRQSSTGNPSSSSGSEDDDVSAGDKEGYICAVCLDVYFSPYMCQPCNHIFCEPCLRTLAKNSPTSTPCPLCRTIITHVFFQKELNQTARTFFPNEYLFRKQNFQKASCAKWPLPSCRKLFRIFGGLQRQSSPVARRQFPHGEGYRLDHLDFEDDSRGWRFDMDMVIIYIYSVNWVIGFLLFCFLCYLFFPSF